MHRLTNLEWWALFPIALVFVSGVAILAHLVARWFLGHHASRSVIHAGPLMPTLGALFAFLSAFVIATEWTAQTSAESTVSEIAAASSRLAWASTAPEVDTVEIQRALRTDLEATATEGWNDLQDGDEDLLVETRSFQDLQRSVRNSAYAPKVSTTASSDLIDSVDDLGAARRELASAAGRTLPTLLLIVLALSGLVLTINSVILVIETPGRSSFIVFSVVVLVALDLALLLVMAAPFRGTLQVEPTPIEQVVSEIDTGYFTR